MCSGVANDIITALLLVDNGNVAGAQAVVQTLGQTTIPSELQGEYQRLVAVVGGEST